MNGFQLGFIESIIELSSYHLRLQSFNTEETEKLRDVITLVPGVRAAVPFVEFQALGRGMRNSQQAVLVRGVPPDALLKDMSMKEKLDFEAGSFDISSADSILLGTELARRMSLRPGDKVTLFSVSSILSSEDEDITGSYTVTGIFRTGYYEYDCSWAYINIDSARSYTDDSNIIIGIKIASRFHDRQLKELCLIKTREAGFQDSFDFSSWRDYNRSFFGALRTEKLFMFILVGLIFIVVGLNIFQAQRRSVLERREEIGLLRAVGGTEKAVRLIFVCDGAIIGFTGAATGLVLGLLTASNISVFFTLVEKAVNTIITLVNILAGFFGKGYADNFTVFSPAIFYIKEIPSRIIPGEVILIFMFGFLSALTAAWLASYKISKIQPAQVLRYE
jgi:lipoprotein-releasing system permease protein